jgi:hypothetical protein
MSKRWLIIAVAVVLLIATDIYTRNKGQMLSENIILPESSYETFSATDNTEDKIQLCVLYPKYCYDNTADSNVTSKSNERLEKALDKQQYCLITKNVPNVKLKFKIAELWSEFHKNFSACVSSKI